MMWMIGCLQWLLAYLVASGLVGLAVTYYYDDPANAKLNTILQRGLQLGGLALVASAPSLPEAGAMGAAALLAARLAARSPWLPRCVATRRGNWIT